MLTAFMALTAATVDPAASTWCGAVQNTQYRGRFKQLIVYSLFSASGDARKTPNWVVGGVQRNERARQIYYPDWVTRYYVRAPGAERIVEAIHSASNVSEYALCYNLSAMNSKLMRFLPYDDPSVVRFISRDIDACLNAREMFAVHAWIASGLPFHCMRDHSQHHTAVFAGMCGMARRRHLLGADSPRMSGLIRRMLADAPPDVYNTDQNFLDRWIWPLVRNVSLCHESDLRRCQRHANLRCEGFPSYGPARSDRFFVGSNLAKLGAPEACPANCTMSCVV